MQTATPVTETERPTDWNTVNWRQANRNVRNLRQRIFRASQTGEWAKVRSLQRLMLRSYANTLVSVRRVTQTNQGKNTAGIDRVVVKTPAARSVLVDHLMEYQPWKAKPARRVCIPKANGTMRPLGIPTVIDRVMQARIKNALEPVWEARFEATSYGFRPGRGTHDAIARIFTAANPRSTKRWVVDADIRGAFDNIDHEHLLQTIGAVPGRELIHQWLKAGYMENGVFHETDAGTPQGGVISPLLANIALHGMEEALGISQDYRGRTKGKRTLIRYADDFVVFCESRADAEQTREELKNWLAQRGLTLSSEKTRIVHLTEGFDFLGFNVRHYPVKAARTGYKILIRPSNDAVRRIREKLRDQWLKLKGYPVKEAIIRLNPIVRGWANYYRTGVSKRVFSRLDGWMYRREIRYTKHQHPRKSSAWRIAKYWGKMNPTRQDKWVFGDKQTGAYLLKFNWFPIERHVMVKGTSSPDDPTLRDYWAKRNAAKTKNLPPVYQRIARIRGHVCPLCGETIHNGEEIHIHHAKGRKSENANRSENLIIMHLYCHQQIHSQRGTVQPDSLEPDAPMRGTSGSEGGGER